MSEEGFVSGGSGFRRSRMGAGRYRGVWDVSPVMVQGMFERT